MEESPTYKDVVIIGNGPSAITLSYMLAGNWPFYSSSFHPVEFLHYKLDDNKEKSLVEQDLKYLSEGLEGRSSNPVSVLFDTLTHPNADLGAENSSSLNWHYDPEVKVDHVVLGKRSPGGAWQTMEGGTLTISLGSWMELPNLSIRQWNSVNNRIKAGYTGLRQNRATVGSVAKYYSQYVECQGLSRYFVNNAVVTSVNRASNCDIPDKEDITSVWEVRGHELIQCKDTGEKRKQNFCYITPHVVLATGNSDQPNRLQAPGEDLPFVLHSLAELEYLIQKGSLTSTSSNLLVVGAGLSAADAVIAARFYGIPTVHVYRRDVDDPELIFNKLPQNMYPEYHKVHQMMRDFSGECYEGYKAYPKYHVTKIFPDKRVLLMPLKSNEAAISIQVSYVLVLIGMHPDLSFLPNGSLELGVHPELPVDCKHNPVDIDLYSHECVHYPGIFAMGPLVGDNFVRFIQGSALAVTNNIYKKRKKCAF